MVPSSSDGNKPFAATGHHFVQIDGKVCGEEPQGDDEAGGRRQRVGLSQGQ